MCPGVDKINKIVKSMVANSIWDSFVDNTLDHNLISRIL